MEGVPAKDQAEWQAKKEADFGVSLTQQQNPNKRPKIFHGVISEAELKGALERHKTLMSGGKLGVPPGLPMPGFPGMPPPSMIPAGPPMFMPPPGMNAPYPQFPGAPMPPYPGAPVNLPFPPNLPPQGFRPPFPPMGVPGMPSPMGMPPFGPPGGFAGSPAGMAPTFNATPVVTILPPQDGVMWPDADASPVSSTALIDALIVLIDRWGFMYDHRPKSELSSPSTVTHLLRHLADLYPSRYKVNNLPLSHRFLVFLRHLEQLPLLLTCKTSTLQRLFLKLLLVFRVHTAL
jgi:hypothetical protein